MSSTLQEAVPRTSKKAPGVAGGLVRVAGAVVLAAHGAIHLMGVALLWRLGEPGSLRYADAHPLPGSAAGWVVGGGWLLAAVLFVTAAVLLVARGRWQGLAAAAAVVSVAVLAPSASIAVAGLVLDAAVLFFVLAARVMRGRSRGDRR